MSRIPGVKLLAVVACLALVGEGAVSRAEEPPAKGPAELQGCWKLISVESYEKAADPVGGGQPRWVIKDNKILYGGEEIVQFTADPTTSPKIIDLKFREPEALYEAIYKIEKDKLTVCINKRTEGVKDRPGSFTTKDEDDWRLLVFEREKAAPANATEGLTAYAGIQLRKDEDTEAVVVSTPIKGSPAEKAGLKKDDVVLKVGATAVTDLNATIKAVRAAKPGEKLDFQVSRDGKETTVTVKIGVFPFHWAAGLG
jgi:uncharacterized protein (TIGR03067 family)